MSVFSLSPCTLNFTIIILDTSGLIPHNLVAIDTIYCMKNLKHFLRHANAHAYTHLITTTIRKRKTKN